MNKDYCLKDQQIVQKFKDKKCWGLSACIDLSECDSEKIKDSQYIKEFVINLCEVIKMKRYGETLVVKFGQDPRVSGYSMTQLVETSLISAHFVNRSNAAYIDVFSCKEYPPYRVALICRDYFGAKKVKLKVNFRY